jgi:hypothetical protein
MALKDSAGYYTKFEYVENDRVLVRRIQCLEIQARDGRLYKVEGKQLPDYISGKSGDHSNGVHTLNILVSERARKAGLSGEPKPVCWLSQRDFVSMIFGSSLLMVIIGIIRFVALAF